MHFDLSTFYLLIVGTLLAGAAMMFWERGLAARRARTLRILGTGFVVLAAGCAVERGFFEEAHDIFAFGAAVRPRALRLAPAGLASRIVPRLAPVVGVIASKAALTAAGLAEPSALARRLRAADLSARARKCL